MNMLTAVPRAKLIALGAVFGVSIIAGLAFWHSRAINARDVRVSALTRDTLAKEVAHTIAIHDTVIIERNAAYSAQKARVDSLDATWKRNRDNGQLATAALEARIRAESAEAQRDSTVQAVNNAARAAIVQQDSLIASVNQFAHEKTVERARADSVIGVLQSERIANATARVLADDGLAVERAKPKCGKLCIVKHVTFGAFVGSSVLYMAQRVQVRK